MGSKPDSGGGWKAPIVITLAYLLPSRAYHEAEELLTAVWVLGNVSRLGIDDRLDQILQILIVWEELVKVSKLVTSIP